MQPRYDYGDFNTATDTSDTSYCLASSAVTTKHQFINKTVYCFFWPEMYRVLNIYERTMISHIPNI